MTTSPISQSSFVRRNSSPESSSTAVQQNNPLAANSSLQTQQKTKDVSSNFFSSPRKNTPPKPTPLSTTLKAPPSIDHIDTPSGGSSPAEPFKMDEDE